jgi:hypothetical protein
MELMVARDVGAEALYNYNSHKQVATLAAPLETCS